MKKKDGWVKSACICVVVLLLNAAVGYFILPGNSETSLAGSGVEAALIDRTEALHGSNGSWVNQTGLGEEEPTEDEQPTENRQLYATDESNGVAAAATGAVPSETEQDKIPVQPTVQPSPAESKEQTNPKPPSAPATQAVSEALSPPIDFRAQNTVVGQNDAGQPVEAENQPPSNATVVTATAVTRPTAVEPPRPAAPVTYSWGTARNFSFRMEVRITNNGSETSRNVAVAVPLLENNSPYQTNTLHSTNFDIISSSGRVSTFNIGELNPGESKTIVVDYNINVRHVSINSTNETVEKARQAFNQFAGDGNCRVLAQGFINRARELGVTAREVIGFARPQRGPMTSGSLQGARHSWAEFYVDGLGWVPVDLTFQYFGTFPHASHIVESYSDQSVSVSFSGGSLSATWSNAIL
ncbi:MAG TPA: transglutaminase domain-containing protein [Candidatus Limnocylindrales bacterium]|nr:transglutaminase domain-containing protein [Candidatus Limnocylindrales bacterium]